MAENLLTYSGPDPNSRFSVTTNRIEVAGLPANEDAWKAKDFGIDHFSGDFSHNVDAYIDSLSQNGGDLVICGLTNVLDDEYGIRTSGGDELGVLLSRQASLARIYLFEDYGGQFYFSQTPVSFNTLYPLTFERDESVGANGTLYVRVYADASRTYPPLFTLSLALHAKKDFRYCYAAQSVNYGSAATFTGYTQNLDHGGAGGDIPPKLHHYKQMEHA